MRHKLTGSNTEYLNISQVRNIFGGKLEICLVERPQKFGI